LADFTTNNEYELAVGEHTRPPPPNQRICPVSKINILLKQRQLAAAVIMKRAHITRGKVKRKFYYSKLFQQYLNSHSPSPLEGDTISIAYSMHNIMLILAQRDYEYTPLYTYIPVLLNVVKLSVPQTTHPHTKIPEHRTHLWTYNRMLMTYESIGFKQQ